MMQPTELIAISRPIASKAFSLGRDTVLSVGVWLDGVSLQVRVRDEKTDEWSTDQKISSFQQSIRKSADCSIGSL